MRSVPIDFGYWMLRNGQRRLLTWWPDGGELVLGDTNVLAIVSNEEDLRQRLRSWEDHCQLRNGLAWLTGQLDGCR